MKSKLLEEFNLLDEKEGKEIINNSNLLYKLKNKIIDNIFNNPSYPSKNVGRIIDNEIERVTYNYNFTIMEKQYLYNLINDEVNGYGPITSLLKDDNVDKIIVDSPNDIYVVSNFVRSRVYDIKFINNNHIYEVINKFLKSISRKLDYDNPVINTTLPNNLKIFASIPPVSIDGPIFKIEKRKDKVDSLDKMVGNGTLTPYMARFLEASVKAKLNIIIYGLKNHGKTTLMDNLYKCIVENERVSVIEDISEISYRNNAIRFEVLKEFVKEEKKVSCENLIKSSMNMDVDRILLGEITGSEAYNIFSSIVNGYKGLITTINANTQLEVLEKLENFMSMKKTEISESNIKKLITENIDLLIKMEQLEDSKYKVTSISEIIKSKEDTIKIKEIFKFLNKGLTDSKEVDGEFVLYNYLPNTYIKIKGSGNNSIDDIFSFIRNSK